MKSMMRTGALLALTVLAATACTRRVQVESEPNNQLQSTAPVEMTGVYEYVATFDSGETTRGPMTITRDGAGYAVDFVTEMGEVTTSNVRREGNKLRMDTMTPGGAGTIELEWQDANVVVGSVFVGESIGIRATRRS